MKFLLDANLSPQTAEFLRRRFSFDAASLIELNQTDLEDTEVIDLAKQEDRIIITQDLDFGLLYHESDPSFGVIILRLVDQRVPVCNLVLEKFFQASGIKFFKQNPKLLAILDENSTRIRKEK